MKKMRITTDGARMPLPGINRGSKIDNLTLAPGVEAIVAIPDGANLVAIGGKNVDYWVNIDQTATATGDVADGTGSTYNDYLVDVSGATNVHLLSEGGCRISLDWRR